ncbi:MAG: tetratricopeptide repeat protein [Elusimicrobiales bacterium]|nr:tetratricopeptide repeat protein [Elusimicrobiales bacterium]
MADNSRNLNIFNGAPAGFLQAVPLFSGVTDFVLPVKAAATGDATLFFILPFTQGHQSFLPAFTDESLLCPPLIKLQPLEAALTLFHAPNHESFMFNAPHSQALEVLSPLRAVRSDISLLAGYFMSGARSGGDLAGAAAAEFTAGRLHGAHYLYALAAARNPASRARFSAAAVMLELGLLQEAYDGLKADSDPEALLTLASIQRRAGDHQAAEGLLAGISQGTQLDEKIALERAWLLLETGREQEAEKAFQRISVSAFEKAEALSGLGAAMAKTAFRTKDKGKLSAAAAALRSALTGPSPAGARILFQLGNLLFRAGDLAQAEDCYRRAAQLAPSVQALGNLALTLIKTGKTAEAAAVTLKIALTDTESAAKLVPQFPAGSAAELFPPPQAAPPRAEPAAARQPEPAPAPAPQPAPAPKPAFTPQPAPARQAPRAETASLAPAQPIPSVSGKTRQPDPAPVRIETLRDVMAAPSAMTEAESRKDDFISGAFRLASDLEDELGRKIYFNMDGLSEAEKRLRLIFIKGKVNPQGKVDMVRDCAAFLCYFLQERHKGRLIKFPDFDPWGWPMVFEQANVKVTTYPVQRVWRLLWSDELPEPGWLAKYSTWLTERLKAAAPPACGVEAAKRKLASHAERLTDTATEHRRMLVLASSLPETSGIETGRSGLFKLENAIRNNFKPNIPPTADGWKLLRCYGHILAETLIRDLKGSWYNTDGEDGGWSLQFPWRTFVFPLGKAYKTAADGTSLVEYYDDLLAQKVRSQGGPMAG